MDIPQRDVNAFCEGYLEAVAFTSEGEPGFAEATFSNQFLVQARMDCARFIAENPHKLQWAFNAPGYSARRAGHDFWLTRNGHGAGFWDRKELDGIGGTGEGHVGESLTRACDSFPQREIYLARNVPEDRWEVFI